MGCRRFGITLLSTPEYYLFKEEEVKAIYYNLIKFIKYKYEKSNYDYRILVGLSNVDGKSVGNKYKRKSVGRPIYEFTPKDKNKGIRNVNWHFHIMICGAPLGTMVKDIQEYLQKILNCKLVNEEFDKRVYDSPNFNKYYFSGYKSEIDVLLSGILRKRNNSKERVPRCSLINLNVNRRKTYNRKEDYYNIINYIEKQSILTNYIESNNFTIAYFDIAKELNLLAKPTRKYLRESNKNKGLSQI
ncbi:MAG: hypothetical protein PHN72_02105 [Bacilli bacterium]|nr:hypothetical protein [Bacilli bacterium]